MLTFEDIVRLVQEQFGVYAYPVKVYRAFEGDLRVVVCEPGCEDFRCRVVWSGPVQGYTLQEMP